MDSKVWKVIGRVALGIIALFFIIRSYSRGNDINVYLYASKQFFTGEDIYSNNPFNFYLYSPFFAMVMGVFSWAPLAVGRMLWTGLNLFLLYRSGVILYQWLKPHFNLKTPFKIAFFLIVFLLLVKGVNHNLKLGQITIMLLWLMVEGVDLVLYRDKKYWGVALIALGVMIKVIPGIALFFLLIKKEFKAVAVGGVMIISSLIIPAVIVGWEANVELTRHWFETINPKRGKYVLEDNSGCQSLNALLPAYLYDFPNGEKIEGQDRTILSLPYKTVVNILQFSRVLLLIAFIGVCLVGLQKHRLAPLLVYWQMSFMLLMVIAFFPHQMKYALILAVPAWAFLLLTILNVLQNKTFSKLILQHKIRIIISVLIVTGILITTRGVLGKQGMLLADYYHVTGLLVLLGMVVLAWNKPKLEELDNF